MALQAWLLSLLAAQKDWRLALLRLGHMHRLGDLEVTPDRELSYAYYINIARQTSMDQKNPSPQQVRDFFSAVKRLITSKIKVFVHIICVCTVYIYYVYMNTNTCMYIYLRKICKVYILNIYI